MSAIFPDMVRNIPLLSGLTEQDKDALVNSGKIHHCPRGQMIFAHGDPVTHFYILIKGTIQLFRTNSEGSEKTIDVLKSGQTLCESEIMDSCRSHRVNALPVEDSVIMEFPVAWLKESARRYSALALNLLSLIAQQAHMAEVEAEQQASMSATQLVACFLQRLCILYDFDPKGFDLPYSKSLIASRLGMEVETFSRTLAKLKEQGITVQGTHVTIDDMGRIEEYVCDSCSISGECRTHQSLEDKLQRTQGTKNQ